MSHARQHATPLKIRLPPDVESSLHRLDPSLPVKKQVVFNEFSAVAVGFALQLDLTLPLKVRVSDFILGEDADSENIDVKNTLTSRPAPR